MFKGLRAVGGPILGAFLIATVAIAVVSAVAPYCPPGRKCLWDAGVSVVVPANWSVEPHEDGLFLELSPGKDATTRIVMEDGAAAMTDWPHGTLDEVEASLIEAFSDTGGSFTQIDNLQTERVALPIGPGVRVRYVSTTCFIMCSSQATDSVWFFSDGRPLAIEWQRVFGEGPAIAPPDQMLEPLRSLLHSLQPIDDSG